MIRLFLALLGVGLCVLAAIAVYNALGSSLPTGRVGVDVVDRPVSDDAKTVLFQVRPGQSAQAIGEELQGRGLIRSALTFRLMVEARGAQNRLPAGEYELSPSMATSDIVDRLTRGETRRAPLLAVPEGWRTREIASRLDAMRTISGAEFLNAASAPPPAAFKAPDGRDLEGYLFPESYEIGPDTTPRELVRRMVQQFERVFDDGLRSKAAQRGLSIHDAVTLASIIEREAAVPSERTMISAVYHNRLQLQMLLQADPTVQYAVANADLPGAPVMGYWKKDLTRADLQLSSPYNTYLVTGLPPGPICNPGLASLRAAVEPADVDYIFFVARGDGSHIFARTEPEHRANVEAVR